MAEDFFGELGKSISRATQQAVDKTSVFIERTKITAQISGEQKEIDKLYQRIGEIVYRKVKMGEMESDPEFAPIIHDIDAHTNQVTTYKRTLADVRKMKVCESCGSVIAMDVAFCPKCGAPAPIVPQSPAVQNPAAAQNPTATQNPAAVQNPTAAQNMSEAQDSTASKSNENNLYEAAGQSQGASAQGSEPEE